MLKLLTYPAAMGTFSPSPFCAKAALLLQMSGQPWEREDVSDPRKMRYGKLPVLRAGGEVIADSDNIRTWLETHGADFEPGLSDREKALGRALIRMAEEHLYFVLLLDRWGNEEVWPAVRDTFFVTIPPLLRNLVANGLRRNVLKGMETQGLGRFTAEERLARADHDFTALAALLADHPFLLGQAPTAADLSVMPILQGMGHTPVSTRLARRITEDPVLWPYVKRVEETFDLGS